VVYSESFETGDFAGSGDERNFNGLTERPNAAVTVSIDATLGAASSTRSLKIEGGIGPSGSLYTTPTGVAYRFDEPFQPKYVSYYVRIDADNTAGGYFALNPFDYELGDQSNLDMVQIVGTSRLTTTQLNGVHDVEKDTWIHVELRDFDWVARTYDLYVDCERVANDLEMTIIGSDSLNQIELFNFTSTAVSWFDEIVIK
jgi:hypothetical protein